MADFVCPTAQTRDAFGSSFVVWVDRIRAGRFEDTNRLFVPPLAFDVRVTAEGSPAEWVQAVVGRLGGRGEWLGLPTQRR